MLYTDVMVLRLEFLELLGFCRISGCLRALRLFQSPAFASLNFRYRSGPSKFGVSTTTSVERSVKGILRCKVGGQRTFPIHPKLWRLERTTSCRSTRRGTAEMEVEAHSEPGIGPERVKEKDTTYCWPCTAEKERNRAGEMKTAYERRARTHTGR